MTFLRGLSDFLKRVCIFFTLGTLGFLAAGSMIENNITRDADGFAVFGTRIILFGAILCFSAFLSLAVTVATAMKTDMIFKVLANFAVTYIGVYVSFFVLLGRYSLLGSFMYVSFIFIIAYAAICAVYLIFRGLAARVRNDGKDYKKLYADLGDKKEK